MMEKVLYNISVLTYNLPQMVDVVENCNGFSCTNLGDTIAEVNGIQLLPGVPGTSRGDSVTVGGNLGEIYKGNIRLVFAVGGATPLVEIIQKFYVK